MAYGVTVRMININVKTATCTSQFRRFYGTLDTYSRVVSLNSAAQGRSNFLERFLKPEGSQHGVVLTQEEDAVCSENESHALLADERRRTTSLTTTDMIPPDLNMIYSLFGSRLTSQEKKFFHMYDPLQKFLKPVGESPDDISVLHNRRPTDHSLEKYEINYDYDDKLVSRHHSQITAPSDFMLPVLPTGLYKMGEIGVHKNSINTVALKTVENVSVLHLNSTDSSSTKASEENHKRPSEEQMENVFQRLTYCLPRFFAGPHDYSIYHPKVVFKNNIRGITTQGISSYIQQLALVKVLGHFKFAYVRMEILKITKHAEDGTIRVRWRIVGIPGYKILFTFWRFKLTNLKEQTKGSENVWYDGFSTFCVGADGLVNTHLCDKMMPDDHKETVKASPLAAKLALLIGLVPRVIVDDLASLSASMIDLHKWESSQALGMSNSCTQN